MQVLNALFDESNFFDRLRGAPSSVLLLDYDGTLAPFAPQRERAYAYNGVLECITSISRGCRTRVAIVSGRPLVDLIRLVGPGFELWASHGMEHRTRDGAIDSPPVPSELADLLEEAAVWIRRRGWEPILERKPFGFALHTRADRQMFKIAGPAVVARWSAALADAGLEVRGFDAGVEARPTVVNKGHVIERVLEESGPGVPVAYLGDDDSDEDAFRALRGLGLGIRVHVRPGGTAADAWLRPPDELLAFLKRWGETRLPGHSV
jgi:trehalose 6-phosphate phosphatase